MKKHFVYFTLTNTSVPPYAIRGSIAISWHWIKRFVQTGRQSNPQAWGNQFANNWHSLACVDELQGESRFDSFLLLPTFFQSTINASTHHDMLMRSTPKRIRSPSPFPRPRFQGFRVPPPCKPLTKRISNRFRIYCVHFKGCNIYANILTKGGEGGCPDRLRFSILS